MRHPAFQRLGKVVISSPDRAAFSARALLAILVAVSFAFCIAPLHATPANKSALARHYDGFLSKELTKCSTCHQAATVAQPEDLGDIPHNPFGARLREVGRELVKKGQGRDLGLRLEMIAHEDSDGDGVENQTELLLGTNPGDKSSVPSAAQLKEAKKRTAEFQAFLKSYQWEPFRLVKRPALPTVTGASAPANPIDLFITAEHQKRKLQPRPPAPPGVLLRRVYLDLIGLNPTPAEQLAFEKDHSPRAYAALVDKLLDDPRYGERWGRHWMDVWRYSDWAGWSGGNQIRDSQPHIWRWRDWIVESLNADQPYDRMIVAMLAADEASPLDTNALRATGFLVRNYKMLSREQWLDDTVKHTSQAFLGLTMGCAKCHDHMYDPLSQSEYYQMRAIFEPHQVRTDRVPGQMDRAKAGLVRTYDTASNSPTYFLVRGDERLADTNRVMKPGVPRSLSPESSKGVLEVVKISLPFVAAHPDQQEFIISETIATSEQGVAKARTALEKARSPDPQAEAGELELVLKFEEAKHETLLAVLAAEKIPADSPARKAAAELAHAKQSLQGLAEAKLNWHRAGAAKLAAEKKQAETKPDDKAAVAKSTKALADAAKKFTEAERKFEEARKQSTVVAADFKSREAESYPEVSTGRRLAFARWLASTNNPLTARVAMNHLWLRHFGRGIVNTPADFGANGARPTHPELLDWLASEFMAQGWSMKAMHRLILNSRAYQMASTSDEHDAGLDPDNLYLWRMPSRRMEAEVVRDNLLFAAGNLDPTMGGPEIDHNSGLTSKRRSLYLRLANEKEVEFLKIFDGPSVTECYQRHASVLPQQALALANSQIALQQARDLARLLTAEAGADDGAFIAAAFRRVLARPPVAGELRECRDFLSRAAAASPSPTPVANPPAPAPKPPDATRLRQNLVLVLLNHNDFITIR